MNQAHTLKSLGWGEFFSREYAAHASASTVPGRIARQDRDRYLVWNEAGTFGGEVTGAFRHSHADPAAYPAVGDWVAAEPLPAEPKVRIHLVLPRRTVFARTAAGGRSQTQIAAANIDLAFLVSGLDHDFNARRIERYVTLAYASGARPIILLNKADLATGLDARLREVGNVAPGVPVHSVSALSQDGVDAIRTYLTPGVTGALLGSSGVGKSTLINALIGGDVMTTASVRGDDSRGRHTTTHRQLILLPGGGLVIDSPGMRELQMTDAADALSTAFAGVESLASQCRFRDCSHRNEPGCSIREAVESGALDLARYAAYVKLQKEIAYAERRSSENFIAEERRRGREFGKMYNRVIKDKHGWR